MINMRYKPYHLPQVSAPYIYVLDKLKDEGVKYKIGKMNPNRVQPMQGLVSLEKISEIDPTNIKPVWLSQEPKVVDGHHRYGAALTHGVPLPYLQIMLPASDAARILNKIQDIYEYEEKAKIEEVVAQDQINVMNDPEAVDFLEAIDKEMKADQEILHSGAEEKIGRKKRKIFAYRNKPINETSPIGNFFSVKPVDGYTKYEIEFDNLLDTDKMGIHSHGNNPIELLANVWFPNIKFEKIAKKYKVSPEHLMNKAISEKAKKMGYDGIKYGDIIIQGLK